MVNVPQIDYPVREQPVRSLTEGLMQGIKLGGMFGGGGAPGRVPKEQIEYAPPEPRRETVNVNDLIKNEKQDFERLKEIEKNTSKLDKEKKRKVVDEAIKSGYISSDLFRAAAEEVDMPFKELGELIMKFVRGDEDARYLKENIVQTYGKGSKIVQAIDNKIAIAAKLQKGMNDNYVTQLISAINTAEAYQEKWPNFKNMPEGARNIVNNKTNYLAELRKYNPYAFKKKAEKMLGKSATTRRKKDYKVYFNKNGVSYNASVAADDSDIAKKIITKKYNISPKDITDIYDISVPATKAMMGQMLMPIKIPDREKPDREKPDRKIPKTDDDDVTMDSILGD